MVDEHAGELLADRLVEQHRGDRAVDAAGQPADHAPLADLRADLLDRLLLEGAHGPVALAAGDLAHEVAEERGAVRGVHDLEVELGGVELAPLVRDHGDRRVRRGADHAEALGQPGHAVAVAHPDRVALALAPHALEQRRLLGHQHLGAAELAVMAALDHAAELRRHRLLAVADAEDRHPGVIDRGRRQRRTGVEHRGRPAGEDHPFRPQRLEGLVRLLERHDLAIDLLLADAPGNELGDLRSEIDDQNLVVAGEPVGAGAAHERGIEDGHLDLCAARPAFGQGRPAAFTTAKSALCRGSRGPPRPARSSRPSPPPPRRDDGATVAPACAGGDGVWRARHFSNSRAGKRGRCGGKTCLPAAMGAGSQPQQEDTPRREEEPGCR